MKQAITFTVLIFCSLLGSTEPFQSNNECKNWVSVFKPGAEVRLNNTTITKPLKSSEVWTQDYRTQEIARSLDFQKVRFEDVVQLENKKGGRILINGDVIIDGCEFTEDLVLDDMVINGRLIIRNSVFHQSLLIRRSLISGGIRLNKNQIGNDMSLEYSRSQMMLECMDNVVGRHIRCQGLSVQGNTQLSVNEAQGIDLTQAHFHQNFNARYLNISRKAVVKNTHFHSRCSILNIEGEGNWEMEDCSFGIAQQFDKKLL